MDKVIEMVLRVPVESLSPFGLYNCDKKKKKEKP